MKSPAPGLPALVRAAATALVLLVLAGCTRTVTWEEEVPLNTGETIWIERSMPWKPLGGFGNPFDIAMRPTREQTIRFTYHGHQYLYVGRADVTWIAISPITRNPVLVARASNYAWDNENQFYCVVPHYVQLVPDANGQHWTWPLRIEPWLYGLPANVMASIPSLNEKRQKRYTRMDRDQRDAPYLFRVSVAARIDPQYKEHACVVKF